jgi:hypothetical protein
MKLALSLPASAGHFALTRSTVGVDMSTPLWIEAIVGACGGFGVRSAETTYAPAAA